jgi:hypothetical protein
MPFVLPSDPVAGANAPASWGDAVRDGLNYLANPPACLAYRVAAFTILNGTFTAVPLDAEAFDTDAMHSTTVNPSRLTINTAGLYQVNAWGSYGGGPNPTAGERYTTIWRNGGLPTPGIHDRRSANTTAGGEVLTISALMKLNVGDYLELALYQTTGGTGNAGGGLSAVWVGSGNPPA